MPAPDHFTSPLGRPPPPPCPDVQIWLDLQDIDLTDQILAELAGV